MNGYDDSDSADMHGLLYCGDVPASVALDDWLRFDDVASQAE